MSSWTENIMEVTASEADLLKLKAFFKNGFCLDAIKPEPPEIASGSKWRNWRKENWGTDREVTRDIYNSGDEKMDPFEAKMTFYTNYMSPYKALEELTKKFPDISIKLNWYSREFRSVGEACISKGVTAESWTEKYDEVKKIAKEIHEDDWDEDEE
jgi:hypothetical protein